MDVAAESPVRYFPGRDGLTLACRDVGEGRPLIMIHGFTSTGLLIGNSGGDSGLQAGE
jgi:hypothetical protein